MKIVRRNTKWRFMSVIFYFYSICYGHLDSGRNFVPNLCFLPVSHLSAEVACRIEGIYVGTATILVYFLFVEGYLHFEGIFLKGHLSEISTHILVLYVRCFFA